MKQHHTFHQHLPDAQTSKMISAALRLRKYFQVFLLDDCLFLKSVKCMLIVKLLTAHLRSKSQFSLLLLHIITNWWFQPIWKICSSNWIISPIRVEHKKYLSCHHLDNSCSTRYCPSFNDHFLDTKIESCTGQIVQPRSSRFFFAHSVILKLVGGFNPFEKY